MNDVLISAGARQSVLAMQMINRQMTALQMNLATGRKVNSPADNPAAYFTSISLSSRASTLNRLLTDVTAAQSAINAAAKGIAAIQTLLTSAQTIANQALQSADTLVTVTGNKAAPLSLSSDIVSGGGSAGTFRNGDQITVSDGTTTAVYAGISGVNDTVQDFLNAVNNTANLKITASLSASGQIVFAAADTVNVTIGATLGGAGTLASVIGHAAATTNFVASGTRQSLANQFDVVREQIDQLAADASFNGVNLLTGSSLSVTFNENGSSNYAIDGVQATSAALGLAASTGQFQTDADINAALASVTAAVSALKTQSSQFGTGAAIINTRTDFTKAMADFLNTASADLVAADTNADGAALLALQARQELAATTLSLVQAAETSTLRLFKI